VAGIALTWTSAALILGSTAPQLAHVAIWNMAGAPWPGALKNATYMGRIARERFAIVAGIQDSRNGAHTFSRATSAYLDRYVSATDRRLFNVSAGWPRICQRTDANGLSVQGYLSEPQASNLCVQSADLATTWIAENLTTVNSNGQVAPNTTTTADAPVANATDTTHGIYSVYTLPATMHCMSAYVMPGDKTWLELYSSITNVSAYFDIANGVVGTAGAAVTYAGIDTTPYNGVGGYYRCWICFTGSASEKNFGIRAASADTDNTFAGDTTTANVWIWGVQIEATAEHFPSSYIPTVAAAVTRNKDELSYNVRLPIVGNINDLPQVLTIGGTDYAPCAYLVADDCQADGTWTSKHGAKSLAFAGAGTNPTPNWDAVSRANRSVKYWASNYHTAADTTWGQLSDKDYAVELLVRVPDISSYNWIAATTDSLATVRGWSIISFPSSLYFTHTQTGSFKQVLTAAGSLVANSYVHFFICSDRSEKMYAFVNGIASGAAVDISSATETLSGANAVVGSYLGGGYLGGDIALLNIWDLTANPWPGAATNQAVMAAIARARFNQLCRYQSCRLDCEILHPNVNRLVAATCAATGNSASDVQALGIGTGDALTATAAANGAAQWSMTGSTDIAAGVAVKMSSMARANSAIAAVNNISEGTDSSCELPAGQTRVWVGQQYDGTLQPRSLVGGVKLWRSDR
jgi:hypothetical protein